MPNIPRDAVDRHAFSALLSWTPERFAAALAAGKLPPADYTVGRVKAQFWKPRTVASAVARHRGR